MGLHSEVKMHQRIPVLRHHKGKDGIMACMGPLNGTHIKHDSICTNETTASSRQDSAKVALDSLVQG